MEFAPTVAMALLVVAIINLAKYAAARDWNGVLTTFVVWAAGVIVVMLVARTDFASGVTVGDRTLDTLNFASLVFVGLSLASIGSFATEIKKALDKSDSAKKPPFFGE